MHSGGLRYSDYVQITLQEIKYLQHLSDISHQEHQDTRNVTEPPSSI